MWRGLFARIFGGNRLRARDLRSNVVVGDVHGIVVQTTVAGTPPTPLTNPWRDPVFGTAEFDIFNLLTWRSRLAPALIGRDGDRAKLLAWARSDREKAIRLLSGPGGAGKSRLAAEFADDLRRENWNAGIVTLDRATTLPFGEAGVFIAIDYPEQNLDLVRALLREAGRLENPPNRIRILLVSRHSLDWWQDDLIAAQASELCDVQDIVLRNLTAPDVCKLVHAAMERLNVLRDIKAPTPDDAAISAWHARAPHLHGLPLIATAAAVHAAIDPAPTFQLGGTEIVAALVSRERTRIEAVAKSAGWPEAKAGSRLLGLAALRTGLDERALKHLAETAPDIGLPPSNSIVDRVEALGWWHEAQMPAPQPDLLAAELLHQILKSRPNAAPDWLAATLPDLEAIEVDRLGRLLHDISALHDDDASRSLVDWLSRAIERNPDQAAAWENALAAQATTFRLAPVGIAATKILLQASGLSDPDRARLSHNLAHDLAASGDTAAALEAIREAVDIRRRLALANPARFEPDLAGSLNNLATRLAQSGDTAAALEAIHQAVDICQRLALANPEGFEPDLAGSLNNLSNCLAGSDDTAAALEAIKQAVDIHRRLALAKPARFEPALAQSLNNLSICLADSRNTAAALEPIQQAVDIYGRLALENPARFEPGLAESLNNLSLRLADSDDTAAALEAMQQAADIHRRLALANPARFEPHLAGSLNNLSICLADSGDTAAAFEAIQQAIDIYRRLAQANPERFESGLTHCLLVLSELKKR